MLSEEMLLFIPLLVAPGDFSRSRWGRISYHDGPGLGEALSLVHCSIKYTLTPYALVGACHVLVAIVRRIKQKMHKSRRPRSAMVRKDSVPDY